MTNKLNVYHLLTDESFLNFCKRTSTKDIAFWENYIHQHPEHKPVIDNATEKYLLLFNVLAEADLKEQLNLLLQKMKSTEIVPQKPVEPPSKGSGIRPMLIRISAAAAILFAFFLLYKQFISAEHKPGQLFVTLLGERKNIRLKDGSTIVLNAASTINVFENFGSKNREVFLEGEAYFEVAHNKDLPFIVHTNSMDVKALGTSFNVKAYPDEKRTETSLIKGSVSVTLKENNNQSLILKPNQKIEWNSSRTKAPEINPKNGIPAKNHIPQRVVPTPSGEIREIAWKDNKLVFDDDSLGSMIPVLERWYGVDIELSDESISHYRYSGVFEKEDIQTVLEFLKEAKQFTFKINKEENKKIIISK
ncbi:MAG TPA: DUF4974 domain-containing protein [Niabella sp.]|nr:DUF4974 domain-containing protein [Niabella sp.]HOZ98186.1 DUF4974 domain-containing protein [Niabella sp.]HQW16082.1 DUF4974 domain-containing protein [Niabella sp.]HQX21294.1 DUF4974 domain-containing protein [Niabella sp.]HQX42391.1 DUF4974 domain-containing protein [Niabella sp.]